MEITISIIIPVWNEEARLPQLLQRIRQAERADELLCEILVVDGGSHDRSIEKAQAQGAHVIEAKKGRAVQMNTGARYARGNILHFVHADSMPPVTFLTDIERQIQTGYRCGCFRSTFDTNSKFLLFCSSLNRFDGIIFRGGGQTLWVEKKLFWNKHGYNERLSLMEEYDLIRKLGKSTHFKVIQKDVIVSARDYDQYGPIRLQFHYAIVFGMFLLGMPQQKMVNFLSKHVKKRKT